jgi:hypothetical protein
MNEEERDGEGEKPTNLVGPLEKAGRLSQGGSGLGA